MWVLVLIPSTFPDLILIFRVWVCSLQFIYEVVVVRLLLLLVVVVVVVFVLNLI